MNPKPPPALRRMACVALLLAGVAAMVQAQPGGPAHATRQGQAFQQLEEGLLQAMRERKTARIEALLDDDFQMIVAQDPADPVARDEWLEGMARPGVGAWTVENLSVRELGDVAVASFTLRPAPAAVKALPLFVVDTWRRQAGNWRLLLRHVAPANGPRRGIPGDANVTVIRKKA